MTKAKVLTDRLRRVAARRGYRVEKVRRVDKLAVDFGTYRLFKIGMDTPCFVGTADEVESELNSEGGGAQILVDRLRSARLPLSEAIPTPDEAHAPRERLNAPRPFGVGTK